MRLFLLGALLLSQLAWSIKEESFGGLGVAIDVQKNSVLIVEVIDGTPAKISGLEKGDRIISINNMPLLNPSLEEAKELLRGDVGSSVNLDIQRQEDIFKVSVQRTDLLVRQFSQKELIEMHNSKQVDSRDLQQSFGKSEQKLLGILNGGHILDQKSIQLQSKDHLVLTGILSKNDQKFSSKDAFSQFAQWKVQTFNHEHLGLDIKEAGAMNLSLKNGLGQTVWSSGQQNLSEGLNIFDWNLATTLNGRMLLISTSETGISSQTLELH